jgi:hypothetical protein
MLITVYTVLDMSAVYFTCLLRFSQLQTAYLLLLVIAVIARGASHLERPIALSSAALQVKPHIWYTWYNRIKSEVATL